MSSSTFSAISVSSRSGSNSAVAAVSAVARVAPVVSVQDNPQPSADGSTQVTITRQAADKLAQTAAQQDGGSGTAGAPAATGQATAAAAARAVPEPAPGQPAHPSAAADAALQPIPAPLPAPAKEPISKMLEAFMHAVWAASSQAVAASDTGSAVSVGRTGATTGAQGVMVVGASARAVWSDATYSVTGALAGPSSDHAATAPLPPAARA